MVNEIVMYQSMFVLGIIMFAFFTATFNNYTNFAEEITIETNMERVLQKVGQEILNLISHGRSLKGLSGNFSSSINLALESEYGGQSYQIEVVNNTDNTADLIASSNGDIFARQSLGIDLGLTQFRGHLASSDSNPTVNYQWNSINNVEEIIFS